ncbi:glycosyltransferase family 4 protein [Streptacidiphilus rugosus]|uniref:glycosyltransferase family 4 protein n=1 Tax=Streptacidiphilus rugosus TaxID=405783 RepID=UPI00069091D2|nr:glycosyltransferase family 4 protein [Streptacidiphilus rugosus]
MTTPHGRPLRVLLVSHHYPPHMGGIENVVRHEAAHLAADGVDVTVLTSDEKSSVTQEQGVRVVRVAAWNGAEKRAGVPFPLLSPRLLGEALRWTRRADVVHLHDCQYLTSWAAGAAAWLLRTPHVLTQHVGVVDHPSALVLRVQRAVYAVAGRGLIRRAEGVFTLNASVAAFVRRHGARAAGARHLANGVDTDLFRPADSAGERLRIRQRLGLPPDRPLVLLAGRLVPKKGFDLLLDAHALTDLPAYDLVLAGDGDTRALDGRAGVHHLGALPPRTLAEVYRACDVFALPSTAEGFPLTVQEAMASGLPVVTTDDPGYAPYGLDRGRVALVPRDARVLHETLTRLAGSPDTRADMAAYSRDYAERHFSWPRHVAWLRQRYAEAAFGRGPVPVGAG